MSEQGIEYRFIVCVVVTAFLVVNSWHRVFAAVCFE
jgi:hypothetical protein